MFIRYLLRFFFPRSCQGILAPDVIVRLMGFQELCHFFSTLALALFHCPIVLVPSCRGFHPLILSLVPHPLP